MQVFTQHVLVRPPFTLMVSHGLRADTGVLGINRHKKSLLGMFRHVIHFPRQQRTHRSDPGKKNKGRFIQALSKAEKRDPARRR
ncbi:MAG: hypothetical protein AAF486_08755, partial [Pseudomonadota bacterium]